MTIVWGENDGKRRKRIATRFPLPFPLAPLEPEVRADERGDDRHEQQYGTADDGEVVYVCNRYHFS